MVQNSDIICTICQDKIEIINCSLTFCNHYYHSECLTKWLKESESCPICRNQILNETKIDNTLRII